jgi:hypothetical protein
VRIAGAKRSRSGYVDADLVDIAGQAIDRSDGGRDSSVYCPGAATKIVIANPGAVGLDGEFNEPSLLRTYPWAQAIVN